MSGFCFLWDRGLAWDGERLERLGSRALDSLSHHYAARRIEEVGDGWWLGLCSRDGEPRVALAADRGRQTFVVVAGWLENYTELKSELDEPRNGEGSAEDADLVLALCLRHGPAALDRLRGPLAAMLWEPAVPRLTAVRDHLGEGSLCFAEGRGSWRWRRRRQRFSTIRPCHDHRTLAGLPGFARGIPFLRGGLRSATSRSWPPGSRGNGRRPVFGAIGSHRAFRPSCADISGSRMPLRNGGSRSRRPCRRLSGAAAVLARC